MKEVTYEDWQKNPTPRMMWVWSFDEDHKVQRKVIYVLKAGVYENPVLTVVDECTYETYKHCAEIGKQRRMTNKELSRWLRENPTREYRWKNDDDCCYSGYIDCGYSDYVYTNHVYLESRADEEVDSSIVIREDDGEWREPLMEVEE